MGDIYDDKIKEVQMVKAIKTTKTIAQFIKIDEFLYLKSNRDSWPRGQTLSIIKSGMLPKGTLK